MTIQMTLNSKSCRLGILILATVLGLLTSGWQVASIQSFLNWVPCGNEFDELGFRCLSWLPCGEESDDKGNGTTRTWLRAISISWPVFLALWWFRTHDTQQQIEKSHAQIQQGNLVSGLNKLVSKDRLRIAIGVKQLEQVSKNTNSEFDSDIRLAFIKRLQRLPKLDLKSYPKLSKNEISLSQSYYNYLPHILRWLVADSERNNRDINECIEVPEMDFKIRELKSTSHFDNKITQDTDKKIPLSEIKKTLLGIKNYKWD